MLPELEFEPPPDEDDDDDDDDDDEEEDEDDPPAGPLELPDDDPPDAGPLELPDEDDPPAAASLLALPPDDALLPLDPPLLPLLRPEPEPEPEPAPDEEDDPDAPEPASPLFSLELAQPEVAASNATTTTPKKARCNLKRSSCGSAGSQIPAAVNACEKDDRSLHSN